MVLTPNRCASARMFRASSPSSSIMPRASARTASRVRPRRPPRDCDGLSPSDGFLTIFSRSCLLIYIVHIRCICRLQGRSAMFRSMQVATLLCVAIAMAFSLAHALELPGKMRLGREAYLTVQPIYYPGFTFGGFIGEACGMLLLIA